MNIFRKPGSGFVKKGQRISGRAVDTTIAVGRVVAVAGATVVDTV